MHFRLSHFVSSCPSHLCTCQQGIRMCERACVVTWKKSSTLLCVCTLVTEFPCPKHSYAPESLAKMANYHLEMEIGGVTLNFLSPDCSSLNVKPPESSTSRTRNRRQIRLERSSEVSKCASADGKRHDTRTKEEKATSHSKRIPESRE
jgi:hypothetical protein